MCTASVDEKTLKAKFWNALRFVVIQVIQPIQPIKPTQPIQLALSIGHHKTLCFIIMFPVVFPTVKTQFSSIAGSKTPATTMAPQDLKAWWPKLRPGGVMAGDSWDRRDRERNILGTTSRAGHDFSMSFPGLMRLRLSCDSRRQKWSERQTQNFKMSLQHPETTVKSMALFHAYLDVCNWGKYVDDLRTPGPGAVLEFVSLLPGRTEAKIGNGWTLSYNYLVTSALPFFKPLNSRIALEYSSQMAQVYLDTDYSFWFFKPEDVSKWHALKPQRLE